VKAKDRTAARAARLHGRAVFEGLEDRRLMSTVPAATVDKVQALPFALEFNGPAADGLLDKDGQAIGLTRVQVNKNGSDASYLAGNLDLRPDLGVLQVTTTGTALAGSNYEKDNTLTNAVETQFDSTTSGFAISTRIIGPLDFLDHASEQGGIYFGPDQDNYVKLVASVTTASNVARIEFTDEQTAPGTTTYTHTASSKTDVGSFAAINTLDLKLVGDASTGRVSAYYAINGGALVKVAQEITVGAAQRSMFFGTAGRAGLITAHKNDLGPITVSYDRFEIDPGQPVTTQRPAVLRMRTAAGEAKTNVPRDTFIAADLLLPNGGVNDVTLDGNVRLSRNGVTVPGNVGTTGGGDAIVFTPSVLLDPGATYTFEITDGVRDATGAAFQPFSGTFTTGTATPAMDPTLSFEKVALPNTAGMQFTALKVGPDHRLYAGVNDGRILRFPINADGTLGTPLTITSLQGASGGNRLLTGLTFDPASTASNPILWVTHGQYAFGSTEADYATEWTSKISKLSGPNLATVEDVVVGLPRSARDHLTNQPSFGPVEGDGKRYLYIPQGSSTSMGGPDPSWGDRVERVLSGAILRLDPSKVPAGTPLDVKTADGGGTYDPFAANAPLTIYASGVRNAFDLVWTRDGQLFAPTNGAAAGGTIPGGPNNVPPGVPRVDTTQHDFLFRIDKGGYYGHPNPARGQYVMGGGYTPADGLSANEVAEYGTVTGGAALAPDPNYRGYAWDFGQNISPDGIIEYQNTSAFGGALAGKLLVARYSGPGDIAVLTRGGNGTIASSNTGVAGLKRFVDPIDLTEDASNGYLYVADYGQNPRQAAARQMYLLRPIPPGANLSLGRDQLVFSDLATTTNTGPSPNLALHITNTGTVPLTFPANGFGVVDDPATAGDDSGLFKIANASSLPDTIGVGESFDVLVNYTAAAVGIDSAILRIQSNDADHRTVDVPLRGVGVPGTGGSNEPSLARILRAYQIPTIVGDGPNDSGEADTAYPQNPDPSSQERPMPRLVKAGPGAVTVEVLAAEAINTNPSVRFGSYTPGNRGDDAKTELFTISAADAQSLQATPNGVTSFDPGSAAFGLYSTYPGFVNPTKDGGLPRQVFSEDALNLWDQNSANRHKVRFFPLRDRSGAEVPNAYIAAFEEFDTAFDSNDIVVIVRNVKPAPQGAEIGLENLDGAPFSDRLAMNRIQNSVNSTVPNNQFHDVATLRVRNTGSSDLVLNSLTTTGAFAVLNPPAAGTHVGPGGTLDLKVQFNAQSRTAGDVQNGTLTINSNDADEAATVVQLSGFWQSRNEGGQEPSLQEVMNTFGYKTTIAGPGEVLSNGGRIQRVGDEVLSPYWFRADTSAPIQVRQLTAFHTQGNTAALFWHNKGSTTVTNLFTHDGLWGQSFLPPKNGTNGATPAYAQFSPAAGQAFGWRVDGKEWSDPTKNPKPANQPQDEGHHVRFWVARDRAGKIIPDTYLMSMDYAGINYDYNDNTYLITNIKPESAPSAPRNLAAVDGGITVNWTPNTEANLAGYNVYRATSAAGPWTKANASLVTGSSYTDPFGDPGSTWFYQVKAVDLSGNVSAASNTISAVRGTDVTPPARPTGLVAKPSSTGITLDWDPNSEGDWAGYNVLRAASASGPFTRLNGSLLTSSSFVDLTAPAGAASYYQVVAVDKSGNVSAPATASATRPAANTVPSTPTGLSATPFSATRIDVGWAPAANASSYRLERRLSGETTFTVLASGITATSYADASGVSAGNTYVYRVRAENSAGASGYSAEASATTPNVQQPPATPAAFNAAVVSPTRIDLAWSASAGATSYRIERKAPNQASFTELARGLTGTGYQDLGVSPGTTYVYRVQAVNAAGSSAFTPTATATTPPQQNPGGAYTGADDGRAAPAGSTTVVAEGTAYDVVAGGTDVNGSTDGFHFAYRLLTGDFDVKVRLQSLGRASEWTKAGLMAREDLGGSSRNVFVASTPDLNGWRVSARFSPGGSTLVTGGGGSAAAAYPNNWLRLKRVGSTFVGYRSADGVNWVEVGTRSVSLPDTVYFGMAATSHNTAATTTARFRDLSNVVPAGTVPAAPASVSATAVTPTRIDLSWAAASGAQTYRVERRGPGETTFRQIASGVTGTSYVDIAGLSAAQTYAYRVAAVNAAGASGYSPTASATTPNNPNPSGGFTGRDIGNPAPAGSTTEVTAGRDYDIVAGGTDIAGLSDQFHFASRQVTGDFDVKVRVQSLVQRDLFTKAGLMVREDLTAGARNAMLSTTFSDKGYRFTYRRTAAGGLTEAAGSGPVSFPNAWIRLKRVGDVITGYRSTDGSTWTQVASTTITGLAQTVYLGMAVTSHNTSASTTAQFREFGNA
jgi:fibronectin type 3 domain-containing protein/regulation of enolase protein 1 (concanavalin A-like superfamily)